MSIICNICKVFCHGLSTLIEKLAGVPTLPWDGIHHQKRRSFSIVILASSCSDSPKPRKGLNSPSWPTQCSVLKLRTMNVFCIGNAGFSNPCLGTHLLSSYELQVLQSMQRGGLGKTLMGCVYDIASQWNMKKVVLTVFKGENASVIQCQFDLPYSEPISQIMKLHLHFTRPWGWYNFSSICAVLIVYMKLRS